MIKTQKTYEEMKNILGIPKLYKPEDFPKIKRTPKPKKASNVKKYTGHYWTKKDSWANEEIESIDQLKGYYVDLERYDATYKGSIVDMSNFISACVSLEIFECTPVVYGLNKSQRAKKHNLVNLFDYVEKELKKENFFTNVEYGSEVASTIQLLLKLNPDDRSSLDSNIYIDSPVVDLLREINTEVFKKFTEQSTQKLLSVFNITKKKDLSPITKDFDLRYPLITELYVHAYNINKVAYKVAQYINHMDDYHRLKKRKSQNLTL